jgi:predicted metal-dependent phosphoesterase TrpH
MHTHCEYSFDCQTPLVAQAGAIRGAGLQVVCATDHDTIEGALKLREMAEGFAVIIGQEISTRDGDLIALFIENAVPAGLSAEASIDAVKAQGGLVSVPHPFSRSRPRRLRRDVLDRLWPQVDCIEVFNARESSASDNERSARYASERNILRAAGSDAHEPGALGSAFVSVEPFDGPQEFLRVLAGGMITGRLSRPPSVLDRARGLLGG